MVKLVCTLAVNRTLIFLISLVKKLLMHIVRFLEMIYWITLKLLSGNIHLIDLITGTK